MDPKQMTDDELIKVIYDKRSDPAMIKDEFPNALDSTLDALAKRFDEERQIAPSKCWRNAGRGRYYRSLSISIKPTMGYN